MKISIPHQELSIINEQLESDYIADILDHAYRHSDCSVELNKLHEDGHLSAVRQYIIDSDKSAGLKKWLGNISIFNKLVKHGAGSYVNKQLKTLPGVICRYIATESVRSWVCRHTPDETLVMELVVGVKYEPNNGEYQEANVTMKTVCISNGEQTKNAYSWHHSEVVTGATATELFASKGITVVTEELANIYDEQFLRYRELSALVGTQLTVSAGAMYLPLNRYYTSRPVNPARDGYIVKVVIDSPDKLNNRPQKMVVDLWTSMLGVEYCSVPNTCYLQVYDLNYHTPALLHSSNAIIYEYDKDVINKLVLPASTKAFIDVLLGGTDDIMEDIIKGKTGGIICMLSGGPGLGKTATAEVYSENICRPLYKVQSAQLGVTPADLEEQLKKVLARAVKWNAVLLIDECDVYLRSRGDDLIQNAVVGVFLRVLEYYNGVLFMTSNRGDSIDDAILSRCIAHINYELPDRDDISAIFSIMVTQFNMGLADDLDGESFAARFHGTGISGRDIKSIAKLSNMVAKRSNEKVSMATIDSILGFISANLVLETGGNGDIKKSVPIHS